MPIKYCIFDIGNVCYPFAPQIFNDGLAKITTDIKAFDKMNGIFSFDFDPFLKGEISITEFSKALCKHCYIPYSKEIETLFSDLNHQSLGPFIPETKSLMDELHNQGYQICLLSNITADLKDITLHITDDDKTFLSFELGLIKPDPRIYEIVLQKLNAKPEEVLFIDDLQKNINAAQALGIHGIVYHRESIIQEVKQLLSDQNNK